MSEPPADRHSHATTQAQLSIPAGARRRRGLDAEQRRQIACPARALPTHEGETEAGVGPRAAALTGTKQKLRGRLAANAQGALVAPAGGGHREASLAARASRQTELRAPEGMPGDDDGRGPRELGAGAGRSGEGLRAPRRRGREGERSGGAERVSESGRRR